MTCFDCLQSLIESAPSSAQDGTGQSCAAERWHMAWHSVSIQRMSAVCSADTVMHSECLHMVVKAVQPWLLPLGELTAKSSRRQRPHKVSLLKCPAEVGGGRTSPHRRESWDFQGVCGGPTSDTHTCSPVCGQLQSAHQTLCVRARSTCIHGRGDIR